MSYGVDQVIPVWGMSMQSAEKGKGDQWEV